VNIASRMANIGFPNKQFDGAHAAESHAIEVAPLCLGEYCF